ncbi:MAG: putative fusion protein (N:peptidase-C:desuccinylase) [Parcubacteria group bacterium Gr01-1014_3]|nr:MAG: putative fusion protein (N:peptidase-C:desuccinylase) [Parcubacteria group bacterium Gr01-1014_3]
MAIKTQTLKIVPYEQSRAGFCGPAALRILLSYFGVLKSEKFLVGLCGATVSRGTRPDRLVRAAKRLGFKVRYDENGSWKILNDYINQKRLPVLVDWFMVNDGHYSVVCGLDKKTIWLADPSSGKIISMSWKVFRRVWFDFEGDFLPVKEKLSLRLWMVIDA